MSAPTNGLHSLDQIGYRPILWRPIKRPAYLFARPSTLCFISPHVLRSPSMHLKYRLAALAAALSFSVFAPGQSAAQEKVLNVVPHSNLAILDPIWTTAYMSRNHGYMIYDTLFATDAKNQIQPQMIKFKNYKPRSEPSSAMAGSKEVFVDKVVWNLALRDSQAALNALVKGEVDILEQVAFDLYESAQKESAISVLKPNIGLQYMCRFNHLHAPFNKPEVRRAALASFNQEAFLRAQVGVKELYKPCPSMFTCGTPYGSPAGSEIQSKSNMKMAQELLKKSGYDGTPVVIMKPTDLQSIGKLPDVAAQLMRQAGFKVDLQAMDWQTLVSRRAKKDAPKDGGWHMFCTAWVAPDIWSPINNAALDARGLKAGWFGWGEDTKLEDLR
ncbi:MAG: hypothetical protein EBV72_05840, partial [Betaproteobacteria bacterium]|nr:hypothetical protein [Betaproteobacteria bacterium]